MDDRHSKIEEISFKKSKKTLKRTKGEEYEKDTLIFKTNMTIKKFTQLIWTNILSIYFYFL